TVDGCVDRVEHGVETLKLLLERRDAYEKLCHLRRVNLRLDPLVWLALQVLTIWPGIDDVPTAGAPLGALGHQVALCDPADPCAWADLASGHDVYRMAGRLFHGHQAVKSFPCSVLQDDGSRLGHRLGSISSGVGTTPAPTPSIAPSPTASSMRQLPHAGRSR